MRTYPVDPKNPLHTKQRVISEYLSYPNGYARRTFINASEADFEAMAETMGFPKVVLKKVAAYEAEFFEGTVFTRWPIIKQRFWPRYFH